VEGDEIEDGLMRGYQAGNVAATQGDGGFLAAIVGDGVLLLLATAASLVLAGGSRCCSPQAASSFHTTSLTSA
jgi:hypothetical protein